MSCPGPAAPHPAGDKSTCALPGAASAGHKVTSTWATSPLPISAAPPPDAWLCPERPRFCLLSKEEGGSFGFHLQQELGRAGHVVCRVEPGTSAQRQGLREGDRILGVNLHAVEQEALEAVRLHPPPAPRGVGEAAAWRGPPPPPPGVRGARSE